MATYRVILAATLHGASIGSTNDVIEATSAVQAEALAIEAWREREPKLTFHPLFTCEVPACQSC
jgi:hypothetical protein